VRWYYARGETAAIHYQTNGNTVARSQGSRPCMVLPETFPADIDIDWYIGEASDLLTDLGVKGACAAGPQATLFKEAAA
jgi:hypothetical protein